MRIASRRLPLSSASFSLFFAAVVSCAVVFSGAAWGQGTTTRVSVGPGGVESNLDSGGYTGISISADGRFVAFESNATNLVPGDTNGVRDIFVRDLLMGTTTRVNVGPGGVEATDTSGAVPPSSSSTAPSISANGRFVAFQSGADNLVIGDTNHGIDVFVRDRVAETTMRVSVGSGGAEAYDGSTYPAISADGRFVAFISSATNLVPGDSNGMSDVFVHDLLTGTTTCVSVGPGGVEANGSSDFNGPSISADGRFVAFMSRASNLVPGDTNGVSDVFVHDRVTGATTRVSVGPGGVEGNGESIFYTPSISADGRFVAFHSSATNLVPGDTNGVSDMFVHDRATGMTTRVSVGPGGVEGNGESRRGSITPDGRFVAFTSDASNLVPGDTNGTQDVFVHDRATGMTTRVSVGLAGLEGDSQSYGSYSGLSTLSADGRFVAFISHASNLVPGDMNGRVDVFMHDAAARTVLSAGDYDGDGRADVAVYRPSNGVWYIVQSSTGTAVGVPQWGQPTDVPVPADYDGDGKTDIAVYRPSTGVWYIVRSTTGTAIAVTWGQVGDLPVPADYDGDGKADVAVYRPSTDKWYELRSTTGAGYGVVWGLPGDIPVPADYDGDGKADPTVFRPSTGTWFQLRSATHTGLAVMWGQAGDTPLAADYDGDHKADPTVFRASTGTWYELRSATGTGYGVSWGIAGDVPIAGDYDGDGKADPTLFRGSTGSWYQLRSGTSAGVGMQWGVWSDVPE